MRSSAWLSALFRLTELSNLRGAIKATAPVTSRPGNRIAPMHSVAHIITLRTIMAITGSSSNIICIFEYKDNIRCIFVYMYIHSHACIYICIYMHMYMYMYTYVYVCLYLYVYVYVCVYFYIYICITYIYMYALVKRYRNMMPLNHVGGIVRNLLGTLFSGGRLVCMSSFDPEQFWECVGSHGITWHLASRWRLFFRVLSAIVKTPYKGIVLELCGIRNKGRVVLTPGVLTRTHLHHV